jgi:hypothetical protein
MKQFKITHFLSLLFLFVLLATTLSSCKSAGVVPPATTDTTTAVTIKEVIHDTIFQTEADSSYYKAYLECVNGKVVLKQTTEPIVKPGKHLEPPKVNLKDNILTVNCKAEAQKLFAQWKDTYIKEHQQIIKKIPYAVIKRIPYAVEKPPSWWQKTQINLGRIFLGIIVLIAIIVGLRFTKYI